MAWETDIDDLAKVVDAAIADANRTLEMKSAGPSRAKVRMIMVEEWLYDEDMDELVLSGNVAVRSKGEWVDGD